MCGEAASDPLLAVVLAGMGFDSVSASPSSVADVTSALSVVDAGLAQKVAQISLQQKSAAAAKSAAKAALLDALD